MSCPWEVRDDGLLLTVRLTPRGGRARIDGTVEFDGRTCLRVRVPAPPVDGAANEALCRFIARTAGIAPRDVQLVAGETARIKRLHLAGDPAALSARLAPGA